MELLKEFNTDYVSYFLELIIDQNLFFHSDGVKWYETLAS